MKRVMIVAAIAAATLTAPAASQSYRRPQGEFNDMLGRLEWESRCPKPYFALYDSDGQASAGYAVYRRCLMDQAANDIGYARDVITDAAAGELQHVRNEAVAAGYRWE